MRLLRAATSAASRVSSSPTRRSWRRGPTASSSCATAASSTRRSRLPARNRCSRRAIGDDDARSPGGARRGARRRRRRRAVIRWAWRYVPPRVAPADPGPDAPHRRGRGCGREHHDRPQHGPCGDAEFGSASSCSGSTAPIRASSRRESPPPGGAFGTIEVIGHRSIAVPGGVETVDFRAQDPRRRLRRRAARAPQRAATRRRPARSRSPTAWPSCSRLEIGSTLALDGRRRTVVGIVENPRKLSDEFALVSPSSAGRRTTSRSWWTRATRRSTPSDRGRERGHSAFAGPADGRNDQAGGDAGDVLRGDGLPAPGLAGRRRGLRGRRAATAAPARHARRDRRHAEAPPTRAAGQRRPRRHDRRARRDDRRASRSGSSSPRRSSPRSTIASTGSAFRGG